ncbi:MAG TPA: response regulator transcription factor [Acidimicrobiales bacterium]|nr:response regulator transcription factor [Acidimicrobiales bacterium]
MVIRTLVIDDHALVGSALCRALGTFDDVEVVGSATSIAEALDALDRLRPDVALVDLRLGAEVSVDRMVDLLGASPATRLLVLTAWATEHGLDRALSSGARGLLSKEQPLDELVEGIRRVHAGELVVCPDLVDVLVRRATAPLGPALDPRELEILGLLAEARTTDDIAARLFLSEHTVRNRIRSLMAKLDAHTRVEAVSEGLRRGLVLPVEPDLSAIG